MQPFQQVIKSFMVPKSFMMLQSLTSAIVVIGRAVDRIDHTAADTQTLM